MIKHHKRLGADKSLQFLISKCLVVWLMLMYQINEERSSKTKAKVYFYWVEDKRIQATRPDKQDGDGESWCASKWSKRMRLEQFDGSQYESWRIIRRCTNKYTIKLRNLRWWRWITTTQNAKFARLVWFNKWGTPCMSSGKCWKYQLWRGGERQEVANCHGWGD